MIVGRLLLRFLLVPLGACIAITVAVVFVLIAQWNRFSALIDARSGDDFIVVLFAGSWIAFVSAISTAAMLLPALLGVLIAEAFAIRSWIYHAANGGLSSWIGVTSLVELRAPYDFYDDRLIAIAAGIAAGFAYWAVAGWTSGFWKPVSEPKPEASRRADY
jgi:hypothetical protein